jgi:Leucine-rich repeat (LRR) protein
LDLSFCDLTELPEDLEDCHKLEELNLSYNHLGYSKLSDLLNRLVPSIYHPYLSLGGRSGNLLNFPNNLFPQSLHDPLELPNKNLEIPSDYGRIRKLTRITFEDAVYTLVKTG